MAQELVLVPKIKYQYLLKKVGENDSSIQTGKGNTEESNTNSTQTGKENKEESNTSNIQEEENGVKERYTDLKTDHLLDSKPFRSSNSETDAGSSQDSTKKAKLFVEAPLSKMGFIKNSKTTNKARKVRLKSHTPKRIIGSKSETKSKWINYTV